MARKAAREIRKERQGEESGEDSDEVKTLDKIEREAKRKCQMLFAGQEEEMVTEEFGSGCTTIS